MATKMTREEAVALLERYSNYEGMGIPNLAGCKEAMKVAVDALKEAFPELAESEDERIRKDIVAAVEMYGDFTQSRKEEIYSYLEKQKENPKSIDSIQSDCMSNVKCEYRWHKVGDSLPDNPREVLCKDEAGNYFIGRYYSGEGWEISNYDDEDKPHHLNPPVSKWIDFPSEKQKEQKPVEWNDTDMKEARDNLISVCRDWERGEQTTLLPIAALRARYFLEHLTEPKPVEWSEEDEKQGSQKSLRTTKETDVI